MNLAPSLDFKLASVPVFADFSDTLMIRSLPAVLLATMILVSCTDKFNSYKRQYHFRSETGIPDYSQLDYWAAHPWKKDPSDSVPLPLRDEPRDSVVDVFFLHPTTLTKKKKPKKYNAAIDDSYINAKTDYYPVLYQASTFNQHARVFAPRYRQAHFRTFLLKDKEKAQQAFDLAYEDIRTSFEYYLEHWNNGRPIIIAAHSQGSKLAERLLKEYFEDKALMKQLVVAYIPGWPVPKDYFSSLKPCADSLQTCCFCSWRTLRTGFIPFYLKKEKGNSYATNPLSWTGTGEHIPRQMNRGSVLLDFNKVYKQTTDARIVNGLLYVKKPKFRRALLFFNRNYHAGDINLFYLNLRENIGQRIAAYGKNQVGH